MGEPLHERGRPHDATSAGFRWSAISLRSGASLNTSLACTLRRLMGRVERCVENRNQPRWLSLRALVAFAPS